MAPHNDTEASQFSQCEPFFHTHKAKLFKFVVIAVAVSCTQLQN